MRFWKRKKPVVCFCLALMVLPACQSFWQALNEAEFNEVEALYFKGLKAQKAQKWEEAYEYFLKAYKAAYTNGGMLRFPDQPEKNNYRYTYQLIGRKMEAVAKHIKDRKDVGSPMQMQYQNIRNEKIKDILVTDKKFGEAQGYAVREKYLEAIGVLEKYIAGNPGDGSGVAEAQKLIRQYQEKLEDRRKELYAAVGVYLKNNDFAMARETLLRMKDTYPPGEEYKDALAYIDKMVKDVSGQEKIFEGAKGAETEKGK